MDTTRTIKTVGILLALGYCLSAGAAHPAKLPALRSLAGQHARVSALVVDLSHDRLLAGLHQTQRLTPASVTKLFTTAAALEHWGPDYRFTTRFMAEGAVEDGVLDGDLMLVGGGDPDLDTARLHSLVMRLRQTGIERVTGDLVVNDSLFGRVPCLTQDRCDAQEYSENAYDAPLSAAGVNYSAVELSILPANESGNPARLALQPPGLTGIHIQGEITTASAHTPPDYSVRRATEDGDDTLYVHGEVPAGGGPYRIVRAVGEPARYTAAVAAALLAQAGIQVDGESTVSSEPVPDWYRELASVDSPALALQLRKMMTYSNNYMADTLTLDLLAGDGVPTPLTLPLAAQRLEGLAAGTLAEDTPWRTHDPEPGSPLIIDSGSGLAVTNQLSAEDVVSLLAYMYRQNGTFGAFLGSLPVPLYTPSDMLKRGSVDWLTRLAAKTGYLTEPVSVLGVAGYLRLRDGGWGAFAVLINGSHERPEIPFTDSMQAIRHDMEALLKRY